MGRFGASRGFQLNWVGHFHASRGFQLNWLGRFSASGDYNWLISGLFRIPPFLLFFLAALCDVRRIMHAQAWSPKRLVVSGTRRDHLAAMLRGQVLRGQALSVGVAV